MKNNYLKSSLLQFEYYKGLGDKTFDQISDEHMHWSYNDSSNSIATLVKHLVGNQLSRWTNFLTEDGEKQWRNRDTEFKSNYTSKKEMISAWESGWKCLFTTLVSLNEKDLNMIVFIRNEGHTVTEAINRQLSHYPFHIGQIVFIGKMICGEKWQSLSIPKNESQSYNSSKFSSPKSIQNFTKNL